MKKQSSSELSTYTCEIVYPKYDKKTCYYQEFWKVYLMNEIMISKIRDYSVSNKEIVVQIDELEVLKPFNKGSVEIVVFNLGSKVKEKSKENIRYDWKNIWMPVRKVWEELWLWCVIKFTHETEA